MYRQQSSARLPPLIAVPEAMTVPEDDVDLGDGVARRRCARAATHHPITTRLLGAASSGFVLMVPSAR